jgi:hypothetical protein
MINEINNMKAEIVYRDLLAITSTSMMVQLLIKLEKPPRSSLETFFRTTMKFQQLSCDSEDFVTTANTEMMETDDDDCGRRGSRDSFFLYCDNSYFKGMMLRLKHIDRLKTNIKVYFR